MEESIGKLGKTLGGFCSHLQNSCHALKQSVERRPIPLDSASSTFVQCLNRRVSSTATDLNMLHSMSFDTVSFEELLGHCSQVYNKNQSDLIQLEDRLLSFGYHPKAETDESEKEEEYSFFDDLPVQKAMEDDTMFDDSMSLQNLGLSDACLATIASEEASKNSQMEKAYQTGTEFCELTQGDMLDKLKPCEVSNSLITVSQDDYGRLPSYMQFLASWEDIVAAVEKLNASLGLNGSNFFRQDEIASLGLGPKGRSYLLMLVRMNKLAVENVDGSVTYRVL